MEANLKAQLAEKLTIVFGRSRKGGYQAFRLSHDNIQAYTDIYRRYLDWRREHPDNPYLELLTDMLDTTDYFFTLKTKMWLLSLLLDDRKDMERILEQLNNESFWKNLFNWRRMAKGLEGTDSASIPNKQEDEVSQHNKS